MSKDHFDVDFEFMNLYFIMNILVYFYILE